MLETIAPAVFFASPLQAIKTCQLFICVQAYLREMVRAENDSASSNSISSSDSNNVSSTSNSL
jgi:hypothetical protein